MIDFVKRNGIFLIILVFICFAILIPINPNQMPYTHRDSGVFLYTGWRITEGELPYRDVWDHKPPVIFFINALGLWLTNGSRWGVWIIECISLLITTIFGYFFFQKMFNRQTAYINMFLFIVSLHFLLTGGNLTSEYVLPLQMITLVMLLSFTKENISKLNWVLFGVMAALAFFTKQTAISLWIALLIYHAINSVCKRSIKDWLAGLFFFAIGGGLITAVIIGYFWMNDGLIDFFNAGFKYNYVYASLGMSIIERIESFSINFSSLFPSGILILGIIGIVYTLFLLGNKFPIIDDKKSIFIIALISLPIEIFFISLSGRGYDHYFISIVPIVSVFSGLIFWLLFEQLREIKKTAKSSGILSFCLSILIACVLSQPYMGENNSNQDIDDSYVLNYIEEITTPDNTILIWGAEAKNYYASRRMSPTKYIYLYPLYTHNYSNEERIVEFLDDIIKNEPKIILDTQSTETPFLDFPIESSEISNRLDWIRENYYEIEYLGDWIVYKYIVSE